MIIILASYIIKFNKKLGHPNQSWKWNRKSSCPEFAKFITEEYFTKHINIKTKLKQKVFTKVINLI
jgi:hypothetical protein